MNKVNNRIPSADVPCTLGWARAHTSSCEPTSQHAQGLSLAVTPPPLLLAKERRESKSRDSISPVPTTLLFRSTEISREEMDSTLGTKLRSYTIN
ncbi:uncharacterized protein PAC_17987 [Phialocephala subalpina]|uniref:Uncharacterized protein n=1 Tax=Phialocephala subalpina TaxID=576137 RepID=A0A1L7XSY1_9HELO|nr:uncharacterized protein PAC_17987 [Phialocephala subalpina]